MYRQDADAEDLLSVTAARNTLSLVHRDAGLMRFVKYVSAAAPGSRWDIAAEFTVAEPADGSSSEEEEEEEGDE